MQKQSTQEMSEFSGSATSYDIAASREPLAADVNIVSQALQA